MTSMRIKDENIDVLYDKLVSLTESLDGGTIISHSNNKADGTFVLNVNASNKQQLLNVLDAVLDYHGANYDIRDIDDGVSVIVLGFNGPDSSDLIDININNICERLGHLETYCYDIDARLIDIEKYLNDEVEISNDEIVKRNTVSKQDFDTSRVSDMRKELYDNLSNGTSIPDMRFMRLAACDILITLKEIRELSKND
jgi:hypothetical protein